MEDIRGAGLGIRRHAVLDTDNKQDRAMNRWSVYLLRCDDGSVYCGITTDPARRFSQHCAGTASKYTKSHKPLFMTTLKHTTTQSEALKEEHRIKRLPVKDKLRLLYCQA
jgi:putative endonuclease